MIGNLKRLVSRNRARVWWGDGVGKKGKRSGYSIKGGQKVTNQMQAFGRSTKNVQSIGKIGCAT